MTPLREVRAVCFDWGGTLMGEDGPAGLPMAQWPQVQVLAGAREALALLHGRVTLAIATNADVSTPPDVARALARGGLAGCFDHIFCASTLGCRKDDPAYWTAVSRTLGCPPAQVAMVGDSLRQDALGPRACGVQGVWLRRDARTVPPSGLPWVEDLRDFAQQVLAAIVPAAGRRGAGTGR
jgi:FMN phosphatase YigB (HAD superfamily)